MKFRKIRTVLINIHLSTCCTLFGRYHFQFGSVERWSWISFPKSLFSHYSLSSSQFIQYL